MLHANGCTYEWTDITKVFHFQVIVHHDKLDALLSQIYFWIKTPHVLDGGPCSSVSIETDYGLDGPGSNPGGDEIFRPS